MLTRWLVDFLISELSLNFALICNFVFLSFSCVIYFLLLFFRKYGKEEGRKIEKGRKKQKEKIKAQGSQFNQRFKIVIKKAWYDFNV